MSTSRIFLALAVGFMAVFAAPSAHMCKIGNIVNRNSNQTYSFPSNWNENQSAPHLAPDQSCSWVVTVPMGYYAKLIIDGRINDTMGHFQMIDANGNVVETQHENKEPYYFPSPKFTLIVNNEAPAKFGFKVIWAQYPTLPSIIGGINEMPHIENVTLNAWQSAYGSSSHISLLAFPADQKNTFSLRSVMVFTGIDTTSSYVNNLYELHKNQHQWISQSNGCFVINVEARGVLDKLLIQSTQDLEGIKPYNELNCKPNSTCTKKLNGKPGQVSGFVSIDPQTHTLTDIQMDSDAIFSVYIGAVNSPFIIGSYNGSIIKSQLPLDFSGGVKQYVISSGPSEFTFQLSDKQKN
ncbi:hypothetical protein CAEBREN_12259 [Caenorhabditis brenneri]|uniref:Uncharacterized protein n=1 Tax=Caenorhabditis brenneri TaxID=135651 RepID=G0NJE6_CAEBE|nr:hypothetical protein CAEBREN_12259 [Caenorhabditis brenneri]